MNVRIFIFSGTFKISFLSIFKFFKRMMMCVKRRWLITFLLMLRGFFAWELVSLASSRVAGYIDADPWQIDLL